ncbi:Protein of unknown function [Chryseobacterium carnipullorum]|uniref:DUF3667 domain-containing protein n=1 Tax=Chryseobacterium carnipullorum TaxID=1124835 RepID=UPI000921CCBF|nr:DUF3667 domain-containing protein [Chryseobacterium carnipullorum]SHL96397.1 Protein of unknown function [Chryseobacterium carnipullorum]
MITCKNCGNNFEGNFCNHCGQSSKTSRINLDFLWEDIQHGIFHYDKGIVFSGKSMFLKPGSIIKEYIDGKRVGHFRPISLSLVLAGIYALIYHLLTINLLTSDDKASIELYNKVFEHYYWFVFITIPLISLATALAFRKKSEYNFYEIFILESFKASQRLIVHILFLPVLYFFNSTKSVQNITSLLMIIDFGLILWTNLQFFNKLSWTNVLIRSLIGYVVYFLMVLLLAVVLLLLLGFDMDA